MAFQYPSAFETEIYVSEIGNVCILQKNYPEDDVLVILNIHQAEWLCKNFPALISEAKQHQGESNEADS